MMVDPYAHPQHMETSITFHMLNKDVGTILSGSTASTIEYWYQLYPEVTQVFLLTFLVAMC